jgi:membrane protein DedA with SNARE-associated domain
METRHEKITLPWKNLMTLALTFAATFLGSVVGNLVVFYILGAMAKRVEKQQLEELERLQQGYLEMVDKERKRMENYARMEG